MDKNIKQEEKVPVKKVENFQVFRLAIIAYGISFLLSHLGHMNDFSGSTIFISLTILILLLSLFMSVFIITIFTKKIIPFRIIVYYILLYSFFMFIEKIFNISITQFFIFLGFIIFVGVSLSLSWLFQNFIPITIYTTINDQVKNNSERQKVLKAITITIVICVAFFYGVSIFLFHQYFTDLSISYREKEALNTTKVDSKSKDAVAYKNRGLERYKKNDYEGALKDFNESILLNSKDAETYINRAIVNKDLQNFDEAIEDYDKAKTLDKKLVKKYPKIKLKIKNYRKKIKKYDELINLEPGNFRAYKERAEIKSEIGNYKGAIEDYTKAIKLKEEDINKVKEKKPDKRDYHRIKFKPNISMFKHSEDLAKLYHYRGVAKSKMLNHKEAVEDHNQAINIYVKAIKKYPQGKYINHFFYCELYSSRAISKTGLGDYNGAIEDYNTLLEISPSKKRYVKKKIQKIKQLQKQ